MKDPYIHVENTIMPEFGNAEMRNMIASVTGLAPDLPKTVGTGCNRRRSWSQISKVPERVTCLACREYARQQLIEHAEMADALLALADAELYLRGKTTPEEVAEEARRDRALAARYE